MTARIRREGGPLLSDARTVERLFGFKDGLLGRREHGIEATQHAEVATLFAWLLFDGYRTTCSDYFPLDIRTR